MENYSQDMHQLAANTIRGLTIDAVQKADIGHPGMPMGMADTAVVLWKQFLKHNPKDPQWLDRDRFVLSAGHGSMLLYTLLHLSGYALTLEEIKNFRQWDSETPGHPEYGHTVGVETTTGPLGQGITNGIGMAFAEKWMAAKYNKPGFDLIDHRTYIIASDGDLMEGISSEASSLAGHYKLGKLIVFWDDNQITIDGPTQLAFTEDVKARYEAYGWHVQDVYGHDAEAVLEAIEEAQAESERPSLIACRTIIGYGSPNKQATAKVHGEPLGEEEVKLTKENLGWPLEPKFYIPDGVKEFLAPDDEAYAKWQKLWKKYQEKFEEETSQLKSSLSGELPSNWEEILPKFENDSKMASRNASGTALNAIAPHIPYLVGGSADLTGSNKTDLKESDNIEPDDFDGRYIHYGVREHAMAGMMNGMFLHGGIRPYGGTFLVFSDYMRPSVRLAALMALPIIYVYTHDSIGVGEDGPTHQPVEHVMSLRAIPNMTVIRPADANETAVAWRLALENKEGPTALVLTRQSLPTINQDTYASATNSQYGAYVLSDSDDPQALIMATGSEVQLALEAQQTLAERGISTRVVSMPSWELFEKQSAEYQESVLPSDVTARVSIEAGVPLGWRTYVGLQGKTIGLDRYGASAPQETVFEKLGLTADAVVTAVESLL